MFKEGVICNVYDTEAVGRTIAATEPSRSLYLYIDYRGLISTCIPGPDLQDPNESTSSLRTTMRQFAQKNPSARFAILRLWSAPHFYPLMLSYERREELFFFDGPGRCWTWKFIPKDMPCSEWSIRHQARLRLAPFRVLQTEKILLRRDLFLVMGEDAEELRKLATGVVFAAQTRPWRLEIDLWWSFVNVDHEFVDRLDDKWLD